MAFFIEFDGESSMSKFEQEHSQTDKAEKGEKIAGDDDANGITLLVPGVKNSRLRNGLELIRPNVI